MKRPLFVLALMAGLLSGGVTRVGQLQARAVRSVLPSSSNAKTLLDATTRHREWVNIATGPSPLLAFLVYPERADKAPVVLITARDESATVRVRAVADQLAAEGFISIVPDVLTGLGPNHTDGDGFTNPDDVAKALDRLGSAEVQRRYDSARTFAEELPSANGTSVWLQLDLASGHAEASETPGGAAGHFATTDADWPNLVGYLDRVTGNKPAFIEGRSNIAGEQAPMMGMGPMMDMDMGHPMTMPAPRQASGSSSRVIPGLGDKAPNLPASYYTATQTLAESKLKKEWVDIPMGDVKLHTWVEYPAGNGKAGVVIVMVHAVGLDDWSRSVADQLASDGFIAVAPDIWSGTGLNGGNRDSFQFDDDAMRAGARITGDEQQRRYRAARDWALRQPRANGKSGSIGFCMGGNASFLFAATVPDLNAAVVFYGTAPSEDLVAKINAPVLGFYGENDARVTATVQPTTELMKRLGKSYEPHVYPKVTHSFVYFQDLSVNRDAVADAWPRVIAFYNMHLK